MSALIDVLHSTDDATEEEGEWDSQKVKRLRSRGDRAAAGLSRLRKDSTFPGFAPDEERRSARNVLPEWIQEQAARLDAGQPTPQLDTHSPHIRASEWQIDAP